MCIRDSVLSLNVPTIAVLVMCLLPNAGSLGLTVSGAMLFGLIALM